MTHPTHPTRRPTAPVVAITIAVTIAIAVAAVTGCSDGRQAPKVLPPAKARPPTVFVVIGGRESSGSGLDDSLHTAWSQLAFAGLPDGTVYLNLASDDATVAEARQRQAPLAVEQHATVAAVWLGEGDDLAGTDPAQFGRDLRALLDQLRRAGTDRVLVASPPPGVPGSQYAPAIAAATTSTGSELVPLSAKAWDPLAPPARRAAVQAAAAAEISHALKR